jgi:hypothetical protein
LATVFLTEAKKLIKKENKEGGSFVKSYSIELKKKQSFNFF